MSLKVALIFPSMNVEKRYGIFKDFPIAGMPFGIGYLIGYVRERGYNNIRIFDEQVSSLDNSETFRSLIDFNPDIAGMTCFTMNVLRTFEIASKIKEFLPRTKVIVGSAHPSLEPDQVIQNKNIDFILRGEGEISFLAFLKAFEKGDFSEVRGLSYKPNGNIIHNQDVDPIDDLDSLPTFPYDLFENEKKYYIGKYITSRGCPYRCIFCSSRYISGNKYRAHSAERVVGDVEMLVRKYGVNFIQFHDDNINILRGRSIKICELILSKGLKIRWSTQTRSDSLDLELLKLMKKAGCSMLNLGIETGSQRLAELIRKDETLEDHIRAVEMIKKAKINVSGSFIIGLPTETREETLQTINFAKKLKLDSALFGLAVPYPGTQMLEMVKKNEGKTIDWNYAASSGGYGNDPLAYVPQGRTEEEMRNFQRTENFKYWLNPNRIYKIIIGEISPYDVPKRMTLKEFIKLSRFVIRYVKLFLKRKGDIL